MPPSSFPRPPCAVRGKAEAVDASRRSATCSPGRPGGRAGFAGSGQQLPAAAIRRRDSARRRRRPARRGRRNARRTPAPAGARSRPHDPARRRARGVPATPRARPRASRGAGRTRPGIMSATAISTMRWPSSARRPGASRPRRAARRQGRVPGPAQRHPEAEADLLRAIRLAPDLPDAHFELGFALWRKGLAADAADHLRRAVALDPERAAAHHYLGESLHQMGGDAGALASLERAAALPPGTPKAFELMGAFRPVGPTRRREGRCTGGVRVGERDDRGPGADDLAFLAVDGGAAPRQRHSRPRRVGLQPAGPPGRSAIRAPAPGPVRRWRSARRSSRAGSIRPRACCGAIMHPPNIISAPIEATRSGWVDHEGTPMMMPTRLLREVAPDVVDVLLQFIEPAVAADGEADDVEPMVMQQEMLDATRGCTQIPAGAPGRTRPRSTVRSRAVRLE